MGGKNIEAKTEPIREDRAVFLVRQVQAIYAARQDGRVFDNHYRAEMFHVKHFCPKPVTTRLQKILTTSFKTRFGKYLVRFGWLPNGQ
ncbi:MAG: hypothetical protein ACOX6I_01195 [Syntrophomonadaceae bacterium]